MKNLFFSLFFFTALVCMPSVSRADVPAESSQSRFTVHFQMKNNTDLNQQWWGFMCRGIENREGYESNGWLSAYDTKSDSFTLTETRCDLYIQGGGNTVYGNFEFDEYVTVPGPGTIYVSFNGWGWERIEFVGNDGTRIDYLR